MCNHCAGSGYGGPPGYSQPGSNMAPFPGQQYLSDPMANMAMQYGQNLADQGKNILHQNVSQTGLVQS